MSHVGGSSAKAMNGKIADRRTRAAMVGNFLIKPGQLIRTLPDCQD
jgi:hypothetical protein